MDLSGVKKKSLLGVKGNNKKTALMRSLRTALKIKGPPRSPVRRTPARTRRESGAVLPAVAAAPGLLPAAAPAWAPAPARAPAPPRLQATPQLQLQQFLWLLECLLAQAQQKALGLQIQTTLKRWKAKEKTEPIP